MKLTPEECECVCRITTNAEDFRAQASENDKNVILFESNDNESIDQKSFEHINDGRVASLVTCFLPFVMQMVLWTATG